MVLEIDQLIQPGNYYVLVIFGNCYVSFYFFEWANFFSLNFGDQELLLFNKFFIGYLQLFCYYDHTFLGCLSIRVLNIILLLYFTYKYCVNFVRLREYQHQDSSEEQLPSKNNIRFCRRDSVSEVEEIKMAFRIACDMPLT